MEHVSHFFLGVGMFLSFLYSLVFIFSNEKPYYHLAVVSTVAAFSAWSRSSLQKRISLEYSKIVDAILSSNGYSLRRKNAVTFFYFIFSLLVFIIVFYASGSKIRSGSITLAPLVFLVITAVCALISALSLLMRYHQDALRIDQTGFFVSGYGFFPWSSVDGVDRVLAGKYGNFRIFFKIDDLSRFKRQMDCLARLSLYFRAGSNRNVVSFYLKEDRDGDMGLALAMLAQRLRERAAGKPAIWSNMMSDEDLDVARKREKLRDRLKDIPENSNPSIVFKLMQEYLNIVPEKKSGLDFYAVLQFILYVSVVFLVVYFRFVRQAI